jgi:hypothetical protein
MAVFPNLCVGVIPQGGTRNTPCIPACPVGLADRTGVVNPATSEIAFLDLGKNLSFSDSLLECQCPRRGQS